MMGSTVTDIFPLNLMCGETHVSHSLYCRLAVTECPTHYTSGDKMDSPNTTCEGE